MRTAICLAIVVLLPTVPLTAQRISDNHPVTTQAGDQTEPSIAVNPTDPNHLVVGSIEIPTEDCRFSTSFDGGETWDTGLLETGPRDFCTDPSVAIAADGTVYFGALFYDANYSTTTIGVATSTDGGLTFGAPVMVSGTNVDKPYIAVDHSGGANDGRVYVVWNRAWPGVGCEDTNGDGMFESCPHRTVHFTRSDDQGATFFSVIQVSDGWTNNFAAHPAVGPDGALYVAWRQFHRGTFGVGFVADDRILIARSATGTGFFDIHTVATLGPQDAAANVQGTWRITRYPVIAVSSAPGTRGTVFAVYADDPPTAEPLGGPTDDESSTETLPQGISDGGIVVGFDLVADRFAGFLMERGDRRPVDVPGAAWTMPNDINRTNTVVGTYRTTTTAPFQGFMLNGNAFSTSAGQLPSEPLDMPGAQSTTPLGLNDAGTVAGGYEDATGTSHGFLYDGAWQTLDVPGAAWTRAHDLNDSGLVVGTYEDATGTVHGFTYDGAAYTTLDYPGATGTAAHAVNGAGVVAGAYRDAADVPHAFRYDGAAYEEIDLTELGATAAAATGINDAGVVVGHYMSADGRRGFRWHGPPSQDVWLTRSSDGGETWAPALRVNDRVTGDQFNPWMCVDGRGIVHATWLDRRDDPDNFLYRPYYAASADGGLTVQRNIVLSDSASDPRDGSLTNNGNGFVGDYANLGCGAAVAHAVWPSLTDADVDQDIVHAAVECEFTSNGDGTVTDECTQLMWVQDAALATTQATDADADGRYEWPEAVSWAEGLIVVGYDDWRLPRARFPDFNCAAGATSMVGVRCVGSEAANLYYLRGVRSGAPAPFASIDDTPNSWYWTGSPYNPARVFAAGFRNGEMGSANAVPGDELFAWALRDIRPSDTPTGTNARVEPHADVTVTFSNVSAGGATTVTVSETDPGISATDFELLGTYYDITTTATTSGAVTVCIHYDEADLGGQDESTLQLFHEEGGVLVPVPSTVDTDANIVCATVASLSWFALGWGTGMSAFAIGVLAVLGIVIVVVVLRILGVVGSG